MRGYPVDRFTGQPHACSYEARSRRKQIEQESARLDRMFGMDRRIPTVHVRAPTPEAPGKLSAPPAAVQRRGKSRNLRAVAAPDVAGGEDAAPPAETGVTEAQAQLKGDKAMDISGELETLDELDRKLDLPRDRKACDFSALDTKRVGNKRILRGFASRSEVDLMGDVVLPSAFTAGLDEFMQRGFLLWSHGLSDPVGRVVAARIVYDDPDSTDLLDGDKPVEQQLRERAGGLWIEAELYSGVQRADEAWALLTQKAPLGLSIGFGITESHRDEEAGVRIIDAVTLYEISIVSLPAQQLANVEYAPAQARGVERSLQANREKWIGEIERRYSCEREAARALYSYMVTKARDIIRPGHERGEARVAADAAREAEVPPTVINLLGRLVGTKHEPALTPAQCKAAVERAKKGLVRRNSLFSAPPSTAPPEFVYPPAVRARVMAHQRYLQRHAADAMRRFMGGHR